jgi:hypothetical protein
MKTNSAALVVPPPSPVSPTEGLRDIKAPVEIPNTWAWIWWTILIPTIGYALLMLGCRFPVSERVAAGVSYQFAKGNGVKIGFRYYYGFIDVILGDPGSNANRSLQLNGYIPIGRGKALAKKNKTESKTNTN